MKTRAIALLIAAAALTGCATPMTREEALAADIATCESYGFLRGTPELPQCVQKIAENRAMSEEARRIARSAALMQMGQQILTTPTAPPIQPMQPMFQSYSIRPTYPGGMFPGHYTVTTW